MRSYNSFTARYGAYNIVRNEVGGLSVAARTADGSIHSEHTTDVEAVWLGYNAATCAYLDLRVSVARKENGRTTAEWLIDPVTAQVERTEASSPVSFEAALEEGLIGVGAVAAYLQLSPKAQDRAGTIVEDRYRDLTEYADSPEIEIIRQLAQDGYDPSAHECLALFERTLRRAQ